MLGKKLIRHLSMYAWNEPIPAAENNSLDRLCSYRWRSKAGHSRLTAIFTAHYYGNNDYRLTGKILRPTRPPAIQLLSDPCTPLPQWGFRSSLGLSLPPFPTSSYHATTTVSVADLDPGSGIRCLFDPWIRDPGSKWVFSGSRIPRPYFEELFDNFFGKKFYNSLKIGPNFFL